MADYKFLAFVFMGFAFGLDVLGLSRFDYEGNYHRGVDKVEMAEIAGFVCATVALLLFILMKFSDLGGNRPAAISALVFAFATCALIILGLILFTSEDHYNRDPPPYTTSILVVAACAAGLAGLFLTLDTCNCKC